MIEDTLRCASRRTSLGDALDKPLVLVGGKGGVGKTTIATALALSAARRHPDRLVRLLSTDPAHSVRDALGGTVAERRLPANLEVCELDAPRLFEEFRGRHREGIRKIALRGTFLDESDLQKFLDLGLPGLDELVALQAISDTVEAGRVRHLFVDTAPAGHTLRLLALPEVIDRWRAALDRLMAKHRVMAQLYGKRIVADEADRLLEEMRRVSSAVRGLLADDGLAVFIPVMNADPLSLWQTERILAAIGRLRVNVPCIVLNGVTPRNPVCRRCTARRAYEEVWTVRAREALAPGLLQVPFLPEPPVGIDALTALGDFLHDGSGGDPVGGDAPSRASPRPSAGPVAETRPLPETGTTLHLVCGKGGVGKTTVACALALRLTQRHPGTRTLLFSTDPAHSLSQAFALRLGGEPREVLPGLDAIEIDPEDQLRRLRDLFRSEVHAFFDSLLGGGGVDAPLDREAMASLMDMDPPGLDEIMALADVSRFLQRGIYHRIVLDTAPTGHFLRFLELPTLIRDWTRGFFEIFLKYDKLLRAPKLQAYLVQLSKAVRDLQGRFGDPKACSGLVVAIPTALSFAETGDLLRRLHELGVAVAGGVVNRFVSAPGDCGVCGARAQQSHAFFRRYRESFPEFPFVPIEEQEESPVGVEKLGRIAELLFGPPSGRIER